MKKPPKTGVDSVKTLCLLMHFHELYVQNEYLSLGFWD